MEAEESLDKEGLMMENPIKIKFLDDPDERERVTQIIQAIIGRFNSDALGFLHAPNDLFPNDTPIQDLENWCIIYDINELSELEVVKSLEDFLSKYPGIDSYPNVCALLRTIKKKSISKRGPN